MTNIMDYLAWRGDLTFQQDPFNEIDALILARLSYLRFDQMVDFQLDKTKPLADVAAMYFKVPVDPKSLSPTELEDQPFLQALAKSIRFKDLLLSGYRNHIDPILEKQFACITIQLTKDIYYISYRGTDNTLVGWKEDFNMTYLTIIPAQQDALAYIEEVSQILPGNYYLGGHSKGGNLAIYAGMFAKTKLQKQILGIYNFDGPGFQKDTATLFAKKPLSKNVYTYVPQGSIIGMLMYRYLPYTVVSSTEKGINQHDVYSWQILGKQFVYENSRTEDSHFIDRTIKTWMDQIQPDDRKKFIDSMFELFASVGTDTVHEMGESWFKSLGSMLDAYSHLDKETRKDMGDVTSLLMSTISKNMKDVHPLDKLRLKVKNTKPTE
ncbi:MULTISPECIES: Mbeg1-like protein [unclassified Breznakia]|uniref:Mbeg1-like protein n=1 Tax=unclassified Breznakia TaxID=2623764 RepID=UPI002476C18A|nr:MULTISPECIES: Mbeg1-like protein [unclassified Breznakia]MDH6366874.1 hypothetical protein [Breznakia sp. PH1-1]MDH6404052.1 hypothetical protein [Breznakia sp. PF1-11]MDH6411726.1 hypothetical protein [Breznakia sp. PFB1-11]MDH6414040.1 hypothetical protein [Breznakia sp. PFB1-14]MDH6416470.1 hypothetical protein [Breznakia sp. PFB1-4]